MIACPAMRARKENQMRTSTLRKGLLCCLTMALAVGYQTTVRAQTTSVAPIVPQGNEQIVRDQVIILVDESGTIGTGRTFRQEKALAELFTGAMPDGQYLSGIKTFAGVIDSDHVRIDLAPFDRVRMTDGAASLEPLGKTTPLTRAIYNQKTEFSGIGGHGALLVFSDGRVKDPEAVLQACRNLVAEHGGELCIFTVQVNDSERGRDLLQKMASVNGCGQYYDGNTLDSAEAMQRVARDIFFGPHEITSPREEPNRPVPVVWELENVHFENDIDVVHSKYNSQLDEVAAAMRNHPEVQLRLAGHTDSNGSNAYNQSLSERRVNAVARALTERNVSSSRITTQAYGEVEPAENNNSPQNMHLNRRVELSRVK